MSGLKGSSMTMGAKRLAALCREIELHLESHPGDAAPAMLAAIDEELIHVRDAFSAERRHGEQPSEREVRRAGE